MSVRALSLLVAGFLAIHLAAPVSASPLAPGSTVAGKTLGEWSGEWWAWAFSFPAGQGPNGNSATPPGFNSGNVFLLSASGGEPVSIEATVSSGQYLFVPVFGGSYFFDPRVGDTINDAQQFIDSAFKEITGIYAEVDGVAVPNLGAHWEASPLFSVTIPPNGVYDEGTYPALAGGYWLMLEPLPVGRHTLRYGGQVPSVPISADTTAVVNVVPEPATALLTTGAALALLAGQFVRRPRSRV